MDNEEIVIGEYSSMQKDSIMQLLISCYGADSNSKMYFERGWKSPTNVFTHVALCRNEVVGAVTIWKTNFHPNCTYLSIIVHPLFRDSGIGTQLLNDVGSAHGISFPLQTSMDETDIFMKDFYGKNGFNEIRRTYLSLLNLNDIHELDEKYIRKYCSTQFSIETFNYVKQDEELTNKLILIVKNTYEETHRDNPPREHDLHTWKKLIFSKDTLLDQSYIVLSDDNNILAFAMLHVGENDYSLEFGWRGTKAESDLHLITLLTAMQIRSAKSKGYMQIEGEIDTTDPYSLELLKRFPLCPAPSLITYQRAK